jgi:hypothetical protein
MTALFDGEEVHMALRERLEAIAEIPPPQDRAWSSVSFKPDPTRPHIESNFTHDTAEVTSFPVNAGTLQTTGLYVVRYYGLTGRGESDIRTVITAILRAFAPGLGMVLPSGVTLYIRHDVGPAPSEIIPVGSGKSFSAIRIPWRAFSNNLIPA